MAEDDLEVDANYEFLKAYLPRVLMQKQCLPNKGDHVATELHVYGCRSCSMCVIAHMFGVS